MARQGYPGPSDAFIFLSDEQPGQLPEYSCRAGSTGRRKVSLAAVSGGRTLLVKSDDRRLQVSARPKTLLLEPFAGPKLSK